MGDAGRSSGGCGRLGVGGAGGSSSSTRALVSGGQVSSSSRVACSVCGRSMPVTRVGLLRVHGPLGNRCAGSGMSTFSPAGASAYGSAGASISKGASSSDADDGVNMANLSEMPTLLVPGLHLFIPSSVLRR